MKIKMCQGTNPMVIPKQIISIWTCKGGSCISSKHRRKIFKRAGGDRQEAGYIKEKQSRTITR